MRVESEWAKNDVLVVTAPTGAGKTEIAYTIAAWARHSAVFLQPDNALVQQAAARYCEFVPLHRKDAYPCLNLDHYDPEKPCRCQFRAALRRAQGAKIRLANYWMYLKNVDALVAPTLVVDEAHKVLDMLQSFNGWTLLQSEAGFPRGLRTVGEFIEWAQEELEKGENEVLEDAVHRLSSVWPEHGLIARRLGGDVVLSVEPLTAAEFGHLLWPKDKVKKLVLLSATISPQDVAGLALDSRRVVYLDCPSPIPADRRPLVYEPRYNLSHECVPYALPVLAQTVLTLLERHPEKGIIHIPYSLAGQLQDLCAHPRLLFHTKKTKAETLERFKSSPPESGAVLMASGLYEGVDLPYDAARWQLIAKVPYLSLADPAIELRAKHNSDWYAWETIKRILQAYGRIVRAPDDFGISYLMDSSFAPLFKRHRKLFPSFVLDALKGI